jgi:hypothetical protein
VEHSTHGGHGRVHLQVLVVVPHEGGDPVEAADSQFLQGSGDLGSPVAELVVGTASKVGAGPGGHLGGAVRLGGVLEQSSQGQGLVLHRAQHLLPRVPLTGGVVDDV